MNAHRPPLTLNQLFIDDLMAAQAPCFAMGFVEEQGEKSGFLALRPEESIPRMSTEQGFCFGHSAFGAESKPVFHFAFEFYGHETFHGLVQPNNPIVKAVIERMLETEDYFFFAINPDQTVTAFRAQLQGHDLAGLRANHEKFGHECCSPEQYEKTVKTFAENPDPPGQMMEWVCRNNRDYLDLVKHPLELAPRI